MTNKNIFIFMENITKKKMKKQKLYHNNQKNVHFKNE